MGGIFIKRLKVRAYVNRIDRTPNPELFLKGTTNFCELQIRLDNITPKPNTGCSLYWSKSKTSSTYKSWQGLLRGLRKKYDQAPFVIIVDDPDVYYDTVRDGYTARAMVSGQISVWTE